MDTIFSYSLGVTVIFGSHGTGEYFIFWDEAEGGPDCSGLDNRVSI